MSGISNTDTSVISLPDTRKPCDRIVCLANQMAGLCPSIHHQVDLAFASHADGQFCGA